MEVDSHSRDSLHDIIRGWNVLLLGVVRCCSFVFKSPNRHRPLVTSAKKWAAQFLFPDGRDNGSPYPGAILLLSF